jgi:hypothetical protein
MAKRLYEENNIKDIANAIREKTGETRLDPIMTDYFVYKSSNIDGFDSELSGVAYGLPEKVFKADGASKIVVKYIIKYSTGTVPSIFYINGIDCTYSDRQTHEKTVEGNQVTLQYSYETSSDLRGVYAEIYAYDASNNQIKVPTEETIEVPNTFKVSDMGAAVRNIGGLPEEAFKITGNCQYRFAQDGWNWYIDTFGSKITTENITNVSYLCTYSSTLREIPFVLNINTNTLASVFNQCNKLRSCPKIRGTITWSTSTSFDSALYFCENLRDVEDLFEPEMLDGFSTVKCTSAYSCAKPAVFNYCRSLRKIPSWWYKFRVNEESTVYPAASYCIYYNGFGSCYVLDEALNIPVWKCAAVQTSNMFNNTTYESNRLKNFTFETQGGGTPYITSWKSQVLDLSRNVGYASSASNITNNNSGITKDKEVKDDTTYQSLKNDPDWFTTKVEYSRYNLESAIATINSLPDTSAYLATAGGTNTIKFKKNSGLNTDGGGITNETMAEASALAQSKGWTVAIA